MFSVSLFSTDIVQSFNDASKLVVVERLAIQEAQLMLTTGSTRLAVSRGQQTWYHFGSIATFR